MPLCAVTEGSIKTRLGWALLAIAVLALPLRTPAQAGAARAATIRPRITEAIDETRLTTLRGNVHPLARPEFDRGVAPGSLPMQRMLLVLQRSPDQESALGALLEQQQDKSSPNYHQWLTPEQFGQQFGPADQDIQAVTSWLQSHGFQVNKVARGRTLIEFSGTASQVFRAFHTQIHKYTVGGKDHWANASDPQIPMALAPVVAGIDTLHNFPRHAMHHFVGTFTRSKDTGTTTPLGTQFTFPNPCNPTSQPFCNFGVGPYDFATIYNLLPLWNTNPTPIDGAGQTIAIVGETDINPQDFSDFRTLFNLSSHPGSLNIIYNGPNPGIIADEPEADIDTQWSSAVAPGATIDFVVSQSTETSQGVDLSAEYIVDNNLAPVLSESYGLCELFLGSAGNAFYKQLWQQAAAQGITVFVASGDQGAAGCDAGNAFATYGLAVSGIASTPYNVAVGGTDFNDLTNPSAYWKSPVNNDPVTLASALGYIPEMTWNDSCTNSEVFSFLGTATAEQTCNNATAQQDGLLNVAGGGGGKSNCTTYDGTNPLSCTGGYSKPSWQTGTGVPSDSKRDLPDVSLFASNGFNGSFYIICQRDATPDNSCNLNSPYLDFQGYGGTSVASPQFAGIMALINQQGGRQGNANYVLYKLAGQGSNTCTSVANPASTCVFYDTPAGSTIQMPCAKGSANCSVTNGLDQYGVLSGYSTTTGYDLATGLGSVNAANLVSKWATAETALTHTTTTLTLNSGNPVNINHGTSVPVSISVAPTSPPGTPTGNVSLIANTGPSASGQTGVQGFALNSSGSVPANTTTNLLPGGINYNVIAHYAGDSTFAASDSAPVSVTVNREPSQTTIAYELFSPTTGLQTNANATTAVFGTPSLLRMNVKSLSSNASCFSNSAGDSGCPTGTLSLTDNGVPLDGGTFALNSEGYAEDQVIDPTGGVHNLQAIYNGDGSFTGSGPVTATLTITPASTQTNLQVNYSNSTGLPATLFAFVLVPVAFTNIPPTGTITFFSGSTPLGSGTVTGSVNQNTHQAGATFSTTATLPHGQDSITAQYGGDANYGASTSSAQVVSVLYPTQTTLTSSSTTIVQGQSVTFTAQVAGAQAGTSITGTVQFISNSNGTLCNASTISASGQATCLTSSLSVGIDSVVASYSGDTNYAASSSASVTETVNTAYTVAANPTTINILTPGQSGSTTLTFTAQNGFSGSVTLSSANCSGLPSQSSCSFNPATINLAANGTATTTLTITTTAASVVVPGMGNRPAPASWRTVTGTVALACLLLMTLLVFGLQGRERRWNFALAFVAFVLLVVSAACGGGGGGGGGVKNPGTPAGTYSIGVTTTIGGATQSVPVTLTVQ